MNKDTNFIGGQRTTLDPSIDELELHAWIPPLKCEGCGERVNRFSRYGDRPDEGICSGCRNEWKFVE